MAVRRAACALAVSGALAAACGRGPTSAPTAHLVERKHPAMGTEIALTAWTSDESRAVAAFEAVFAEFDRLDAMMSVWTDGSDIVRLNAAAGDHPVRVSPEMREVLDVAHQVSEWTGGRFDVTFGALSDLWKFDQDQDNRIPDPR